MSEQIVIDSVEFAHRRGVLNGRLDVGMLPRLHDLLASVTGDIEYSLEGSVGVRGRPQLRLKIGGVLPLACQRCLGAVDHDLQVDSLLEVIDSEDSLTQEEIEDDSKDFLTADKELDVVALIEDELLLALPVVPRHEQCAMPEAARSAGGEEDHLSPFGALAGLKRTVQ